MIIQNTPRALLLFASAFVIIGRAVGDDTKDLGKLPLCAQACIAEAFIECPSCTMGDLSCRCSCSSFTDSAKTCIKTSCSVVQPAFDMVSCPPSSSIIPAPSQTDTTTSSRTSSSSRTSISTSSSSSVTTTTGSGISIPPTITSTSSSTWGPYWNLTGVTSSACAVETGSGASLGSSCPIQVPVNSARIAKAGDGLVYFLWSIGGMLALDGFL